MEKFFDIATHNPKRIIVAGDWHRNPHAAWPIKVIEFAASQGIDTIVHVGDFGYKYGSRDYYMFELPLHQALLKHGIKLVWIDGNHENHQLLRSLPKLENGFIRTGAEGNIYYAPRGHRWHWSGRNFGALGGAWSPSWKKLKEGETLFLELEQPTWQDLEVLGNEPLDYLISHDAPAGVTLETLLGIVEDTDTRAILQKAVDTTKPSRVFSGHWHRRFDYVLTNGTHTTHGHILDKEWNTNNILILDLELNQILPLPDIWRNYKKQ